MRTLLATRSINLRILLEMTTGHCRNYGLSFDGRHQRRSAAQGGPAECPELALVANCLHILAEARRVCLCAGEEALLPRLGAGTALLSAERHAGLKTQFDRLDPTSGRSWALRINFVAVFGLFVVTGWGAQSPWQNRCTAAVFVVYLSLIHI